MRNKKFGLIIFALIISMLLQSIPLAFAAAPKYERVLKIVSGSQKDIRNITYNDHVVSKGFAVDISMMAPIVPGTDVPSNVAFAVSLGESWVDYGVFYEPRVSQMWMKIQGDSNFEIRYKGSIVTNTGTGGKCTSSWEILLDILLEILQEILYKLCESPPLIEWQGGPPSEPHWAKAIVRSEAPFPDGVNGPTPFVQTAGCSFGSKFGQRGYQYLTITAGADICVLRWYEDTDGLKHWETIYVGTYSVACQAQVPVTNEPETPSTPSGPTSGYRYTSYTYSSVAIDPDGDNIRYQFDWGDGTTTTTGWYASGITTKASHYWTSTGTYNIKVRAQDIYEEWSCWSAFLTVSISSGGGGGGGGCPILAVFDGTEYLLEGLLDIHNPQGVDVVYEHMLIATPKRMNGKYLLRLTEHPQTHSYIDQVKLYAILKNNRLIELPLIRAWHSEYGNVLPQLLFSDNWKAEASGANWNNGASQSIDLKFVALPPNVKAISFIFKIEGNNPYLKSME